MIENEINLEVFLVLYMYNINLIEILPEEQFFEILQHHESTRKRMRGNPVYFSFIIIVFKLKFG